ncbi:F8A1-like protein [Schistosoma mansoni]|uniref:F8A1-like protein n=1 Tax=Schistosoma mansoni TaxID=6183 RepID=UPI0001A6354B|nr:F8A1-like protein [Schistosoma mansoni]|eukprot:XP_018648760.1 F8A1-like protein [Schistosoma mansoni]
MDPSLNYPQIYKALSTDVKKKLNEINMCDQQANDFACVAKSLAVQECHELAAVFLLGKARCEFAAKNVTSEASTLFTAAKYFIQADDKLISTNSINYEDNLNCAILCLLRTARIYELNELFTLATNVYIYLVDTLMRRSKFHQAIPYLKRSIEIVSKDVLLSLELYKRLSYCQLYIHDWPGALTTFIFIQNLAKEEFTLNSFDLYIQYWSISEIFRVLLILLCMPSYRLRNPDLTDYSLKQYDIKVNEEINEDLLKSSTLNSIYLDHNLFILLQSFVLAHRSKDIIELESLSVMLQSYVNLEQRELISLILREVIVDTS